MESCTTGPFAAAGAAPFSVPIQSGQGPIAAAMPPLPVPPKANRVSFATKVCVLPIAQQVIGGASVLINVARLIKNVAIYAFCGIAAPVYRHDAWKTIGSGFVLKGGSYGFLNNIPQETKAAWIANNADLKNIHIRPKGDAEILSELSIRCRAALPIVGDILSNETEELRQLETLAPTGHTQRLEIERQKVGCRLGIAHLQRLQNDMGQPIDTLVKAADIMRQFDEMQFNKAPATYGKGAEAIHKAARCYFIKELAKIRCENNLKSIGLGLTRFIPIVGTVYSATKWYQGSKA